MLTNIPPGFQIRYFQETEGDTYPQISVNGASVEYPAFVREITREDGTPSYKWIPAILPNNGHDTSDPDRFALLAWSDLRRFFYGPQAAQSEMRDDHAWEGHRQAVRSIFPKYTGEQNTAEARFQAIKTSFWETIDAALKEINVPRSELPAYFTAETMLALAVSKGMEADRLAVYSQKFATLSLDLLHNDRNWIELFNG